MMDKISSYSGKMTACTPTTAARVERWAAERDDTFKRSLGRLKADIIRANALVQEANFLAEEMRRNTRFSVTLQIPPQNLSPNRKVRLVTIFINVVLNSIPKKESSFI